MASLKQTIVDYIGTVRVAIINRKGGTGKTFVTANLAAELALRGLKVGIVDTDAQGAANAALVLGIYPDVRPPDGLYRVLVERRRLVEEVARVSSTAFLSEGMGLEHWGEIFVLPGGARTFTIPQQIDDAGAFDTLASDFCDAFELDVLLVDTGPGRTLFDGAVYDAVDSFLFVTQPETLSLAGIDEAISEIERRNRRREQRGERPAALLGIVPNQVARWREHKENLNALGAAFPHLVWKPISHLTAYSLMATRGQAVRAYSISQREKDEMIALGDQFEERVTAWLTT